MYDPNGPARDRRLEAMVKARASEGYVVETWGATWAVMSKSPSTPHFLFAGAVLACFLVGMFLVLIGSVAPGIVGIVTRVLGFFLSSFGPIIVTTAWIFHAAVNRRKRIMLEVSPTGSDASAPAAYSERGF